MAQRHQQTKMAVNKNQGAIEQNTIIDDNLLPSADELEKLKQIDPNIISWIMARTEQEQNARLKFNDDRIKIANKELGITTTSLWLAFILAISALILGGLFIYLDKEIAGTIFGSVGIIAIIQSFLRFGRKEKQ
ncbi:MAG: hypothetical protein LBK94_06455 [Prevotellaceae bacterium]|jgi:uncharacterized membrane protein|nr:hypothetical protein [Prevotellaceae bacterium]